MRFNNIVTSPCKERNWAYINFLQVGKHIVMPSLQYRGRQNSVSVCQKRLF